MKTAISVPDRVFQRASHHAQRLGMSRSEFFTKAAERWADELDGAELTDAINEAIELAGPDDTADFSGRAARLLWRDESSIHGGGAGSR